MVKKKGAAFGAVGGAFGLFRFWKIDSAEANNTNLLDYFESNILTFWFLRHPGRWKKVLRLSRNLDDVKFA